MASNKLKVSLIAVGILALALGGYSFLVGAPQVDYSLFQTEENVQSAILEINYGNGQVDTFELEPNGSKNLFRLMKERFESDDKVFVSESYAGLGQLVTQIGDKKNGEDGKYWQFWVNGEYATVGVSSYTPKVGDKITWKFTDEMEQ